MHLKDYLKLRLLGKGSFGSVYKVRHLETNEIMALKEMNIKPMNTIERKTALNEVRLLASINHPNIIEYKSAFLEEGRLYIVTELAEAGDLDHLIQKHQQMRKYLDEDLLWRYISEICAGLSALHKHGIIHRDLKCSNILICKGGVLKLADFGVAKLMKGAEYVHTSIGTPYYLSPEQWKDQPYNEKTDMWSLGVVLYEMTALRLPFQGVNMNDLSRNVVTGSFPRLPSHVGPELQNLISRLLVKNPKIRPSVDEVLQLPMIRAKQQPAVDKDVQLIATIALPRRMSKEHIDLPLPNQVPPTDNANGDSNDNATEARNPPLSAPHPRRRQSQRPQAPEISRPRNQNPQRRAPSAIPSVAEPQHLPSDIEPPQQNQAREGYSRLYGVSSRDIVPRQQDFRMPQIRPPVSNQPSRVPSVFPSARSIAPTPSQYSIVDHRRRRYDNHPHIGPNRLF